MQRLLSLIRLSSDRLAELLGMRMARMYSVGLFCSFALLVWLLPADSGSRALDSILGQALTTASWMVAGLSALSAARDLGARDRQDGVTALAAMRGHDVHALELSRVLAATWRIALAVGLPVVTLALCGGLKLRDPVALRWTLGWVLIAVVYALCLGVVLAALARGSALMSPRHGRLLLILLVLVPEAVSYAVPEMPSVPRAFGRALHSAREGGSSRS